MSEKHCLMTERLQARANVEYCTFLYSNVTLHTPAPQVEYEAASQLSYVLSNTLL